MSVWIRRAADMLITPEQRARFDAFIARREREARAAILKAEKRLLRSLNRPAAGPPAPYRAPTSRPTVFFTTGWGTVTAEMIEAMAEDDELNDLVLGLAAPASVEEDVLEESYDDFLTGIERRRGLSLACDPKPRRKTPSDRQYRGPQRLKYAA